MALLAGGAVPRIERAWPAVTGARASFDQSSDALAELHWSAQQRTMTRASLLAALALTFATSVFAQPPPVCRNEPVPDLVEGQAFAVDGDTLAIAGMPRIRLWGIQAPDLRDSVTKRETREGMRARTVLAGLLDGVMSVRCVPTRWDGYCRLVAVCDAKGDDLAQDMLIRGMAFTARLDDSPGESGVDPLKYILREVIARQERRGLWRHWPE